MSDSGRRDAPASDARGETPGPFATLLASLGGNLFLLFGTTILGSLGLLTAWFPPRGNATFWVAKVWSWCLLASSGVRVTTEVKQRLDRSTGYVYLANHQSLFDIPAIIATVPTQLRFAAKRGLFRIPIFGWALWASGFIPVDRGHRTKARRTLAVAQKRLDAGTSVLFFPEGTRSRDGRLMRFKHGGFTLAMTCQVPIVPVGIQGTFRVQSKESFVIRPGKAIVRYGAPIDPAGLERAELERQVREAILSLSEGDTLGDRASDRSSTPA